MRNAVLSKSRAISQVAFWMLFVVIIIASRNLDNHSLYIIPRFSPYLCLILSLIKSSVFILFIPAIILFAISFIFGRYFCGWICPLGTTIDATDKALSAKSKPSGNKRNIKYIILLVSVILALAGIQTAGLLDPISTAVRSYGTLYSYIDTDFKIFFDTLYKVPFVNSVSEPVYSFLKNHLLDFNQIVFYNHLGVLLFFVMILMLSFFARRFWCRALCPLGALYALSAKFALLKRKVDADKCTNCIACEKSCRMNAIHADGEATLEGECIKCFECLKACEYDAIEFKFSSPLAKDDKKETIADSTKFTRKNLITGIFASLIATPLFKHKTDFIKDHTRLIRPPGALPEQDFLNTCVRCGQCIKVCPTNALHPLMFEYGIDAAFTPHLVPRIGWCEKNCNRCSQICPSGALQKISVSEKETTIIGTAYILKDLCLPWSEQKDCLVCEEMCPTKKKSVIFKKELIADINGIKKHVKLPYIVKDTCIGCGICENKCPVAGGAVKIISNYGLLKNR